MRCEVWKRAGVTLLWILLLVGETTPTVYREIVYEGGTSCTEQKYTTEYFGIPDDSGLSEFYTCFAGPGDVPRFYFKYSCVNSTVVAGMYVDSICYGAVEGPGSTDVELTSELCTSNKTTSCSSTNPNTTASHSFSISVEMFTSPSCPTDEVVDVLDEVDDFRHPQTNATRECYPSETLDFNSKLVCANGELKTFYYDVSDDNCMLSPRAMSSSPSCLKMGAASYNKVSCEASSGSPKQYDEEPPPPLARDSSADVPYYYIKQYSDDSCDWLQAEIYYSGIPYEGSLYNFDECTAYENGAYLIMTCDETSGALDVDVHLSSRCSWSFQTMEDVNSAGVCQSSTKHECTTIAPTYEATIDDWDVLVEFQVDAWCSSSTGERQIVTWAEIVEWGVYADSYASSIDLDDDYASSDKDTALTPSPSCSASGKFPEGIRCVDGTMKEVIFRGEDTDCTGPPLKVTQISSCVVWEGEDNYYAKLTCVEVISPTYAVISPPDEYKLGNDTSGHDVSSAHPSKYQQCLFETTTGILLMTIFLVLENLHK